MAPWTVTLQASLPIEFSRKECYSRLPFPTPGDLPDAGIKPVSFVSPVLAGGFFITRPPGKPDLILNIYKLISKQNIIWSTNHVI